MYLFKQLCKEKNKSVDTTVFFMNGNLLTIDDYKGCFDGLFKFLTCSFNHQNNLFCKQMLKEIVVIKSNYNGIVSNCDTNKTFLASIF